MTQTNTDKTVSTERLEDTSVMRLETSSENIARDMAEGRFPRRSDPQMVPVDRPDAGVKVKPLEWHKSHMPSWNDDWHTTTPLIYTIRCADENGWKWSSHGGCGYASTPDAAKAAAQADYEQRILSALEPSPIHKGEARGRHLWAMEEIAATLLSGDRAAATKLREAIDFFASPHPVTITPEEVVREEQADYLVWSNEHRAWWRANSQGYARSILEAGRYTRAEAVDIADKSRNGWKMDQRPDEIAVAIADLPPPIRAALSVKPGEQG